MITCNGDILQSGRTGASEGAVLCLGTGAMAPGMAITVTSCRIPSTSCRYQSGKVSLSPPVKRMP